MPESLPSINLAKGKQTSFIDRFLNWALTIGRPIVIFTEIVALATFVYRFSLDERLSDLHSEIKKKQALVALLKNDENKYNNLHNRLALISSSSEKATSTNRIINDIIYLLPQGIKINDLTLNRDRINMGVNVDSVSSLTDFINSLKSYPSIKSINIDNIENKPLIGLLVIVTAMLR